MRYKIKMLQIKIFVVYNRIITECFLYLFTWDLVADEILSPQRTLPPPLPPKSPRLISAPQRRAISGPSNSGTNGNDQLQTKLRRLLNTDSKENVFFSENPSVLKPSTINNGRDGDFRYSPGSPLAACRDDTDGRSTRVINSP